ncbi:MAG: patatin-like phospholipase family protein, partial [Oscillospiraceae bacterium]|nr:patatin-like phospholipase family protein [Oscillospiraceae bacterium]
MKTGLVLEGGALRTIFSAGVCDALLAGGIACDYLIGVSAGIAYGVSYISGQQGRNLEVATRFAPDRRYMGVGNLLNRNNRSYFGLDFTFRRIPEEFVPFDYKTFADYP